MSHRWKSALLALALTAGACRAVAGSADLLQERMTGLSCTPGGTITFLAGTGLPAVPTVTPAGDAELLSGDAGALAGVASHGSSYTPVPERSFGSMFFRGWAAITGVEIVLLAGTASLPREWTGWSETFVEDGLRNLGRAWTSPPVMDDDAWFHNYVGHPYGGGVYYNTVRCQGASPAQSLLFTTVLSLQWEYVFEAVAERPSIQDIVITPIAGMALGEGVHRLTLALQEGGTSLPEKAVILVLNPMHVLFAGFNGR